MASSQLTSLLSQFDSQSQKAIAHLKEELAAIRTGRAHTSLVEQLPVQAYGSTMPLVQLATLSVPDAKTIMIDPWDKSLMKDVEKALQASNLGLNPAVDGKVIRLRLPDLTGERREELRKVVNTRVETGRVAVRNLREDVVKQMKKMESADDSSVSEDDLERTREELQKRVTAVNKEIDAIKAKKEQEILTV